MKRLLCCSALAALACISAPEIVMVDRATALEQQAAGSFGELEQKLTRTAIVPRPVPLTPEQLEALGIHSATLTDDTDSTEADRVDELLRRRCVGEGREGLLVDTHRDCRGGSDRAAAIALIERVNRARVQLWRWMGTERKDVSPAALQHTWRQVHARGVVCGAWVQRDDGAWEEKKC
jgi:hypothetical protein